jgi:glycine/D-amino acid oxidase-like deaminating enzyme
MKTADIAICGAGIAGIAAAHALLQRGHKRIVVLDDRPPLTLTSDKSTECYRNWWPDPAMVGLMNRSINLMEDLARRSGNRFQLNRRGYVYATANPRRIKRFRRAAEQAALHGAGPLRTGGYTPAPAHGFEDQPDGADLLTDPALIRRHFPYLTERTVAVLHARRAGWFSGQQLGMYLWERARAGGVELIPARVEAIDAKEKIRGLLLANGERIATDTLILAAGPLLPQVVSMLGLILPVYSERHAKLAFADSLGVIPRDAPFLIWADPQTLPWSPEERDFLAESPDTQWMLGNFPPGVHTRPEGSRHALMLWAYDARPVEPLFPPQFDPSFPDIVLRGLTTMLPGLQAYLGHAPRPNLDGGYYTKTRENRPLIGPLPIPGAHVLGALSGYGLMAACGAADLLATHLSGDPLPDYAPAFAPNRYADPAYLEWLSTLDDTGQL